jgi:hypothetical protein
MVGSCFFSSLSSVVVRIRKRLRQKALIIVIKSPFQQPAPRSPHLRQLFLLILLASIASHKSPLDIFLLLGLAEEAPPTAPSADHEASRESEITLS